MATAVQQMRQDLADHDRRIAEFEAQFNDDNPPTPDDVTTQEAMYSAREDIRTRLAQVAAFNARRGTDRGTLDDVRAGALDGTPGPVRGDSGRGRIISLGERFAQSEEYSAFLKKAGGRMPTKGHIPEMDAWHVGGMRELGIYSDLITGGSSTSGGAFVVTDRFAELTDLGRRPLNIRDVVRILRTSSDLVEFVRQTSRTNNAAPVAEATDSSGGSGVKPESATAFEVVQTPVKTIANWMAVTRQAVADVPQMRDLIDQELRDNVLEELEDQVIAGDGTGQNFTGILNTSGTQAQAFDTDPLTTLRRARTKVRTVARRTPSAYGMHPNDWEDIDLLQDNEARYYFGGPAAMGTPRIWGLPVFENEAFPEGTAVVADWRRAAIWDREDIAVLVSDSHQDFFVRNLLAILAEMRAAFGVLQPNAFVEIDLVP